MFGIGQPSMPASPSFGQITGTEMITQLSVERQTRSQLPDCRLFGVYRMMATQPTTKLHRTARGSPTFAASA